MTGGRYVQDGSGLEVSHESIACPKSMDQQSFLDPLTFHPDRANKTLMANSSSGFATSRHTCSRRAQLP